MEIGYTRVSTRGQKIDSQIARLEAAGCERIFLDTGYSSRLEDRPEWNKCREMQRQGDRLTIPALDRVAGTDPIALSVMRVAMLKIMATLAHLRVALIRENTRRGVEFARSQGRVGGRLTVMTPERIEMARQMREADPPMSYDKITEALGVGRNSVVRALSRDVQR